MTKMEWAAHPRARRLLADLAYTLADRNRTGSRIALLIGAGVDRQLTGRELWAGFLKKLAQESDMSEIEREALASVAGDWPVEAAEALRISMGRAGYREALKGLTSHTHPKESGMAGSLANLINKGIDLIVNFNYTRDLEEAIESEETGREVVVIQRGHLPGWEKPDLLSPKKGTIHLLALHGRADDRLGEISGVVLDRQSYDEAVFSDFHYSDLLSRLFQDYTILSLGLSWNDVVLRNAAARVHHASPLYGRTHAAFFPASHENPERPKLDPRRVDLWRERSLMAAYSVRPLFYRASGEDHSELVGALDNFCQMYDDATAFSEGAIDLPGWLDFDLLSPIADRLDLCGDYESLLHRWWFSKNWGSLCGLLKKAHSLPVRPTQWLVLARLERHLRHYVWVYEDPERRKQERQEVWYILAEMGRNLAVRDPSIFDPATLGDAIGPSRNNGSRGLFEFAIGAYEIFPDQAATSEVIEFWRDRLRSVTDAQLQGRVEVAKLVWKETTGRSADELRQLRRLALASGWEAMEAKVALDLCECMFREKASRPSRAKLRDLPEEVRHGLLLYAKDAREVARVAGSARRELGAVALGSLITDPETAEADLIGVYQGFSKRLEAGAGPVGDWAIYVGLLASLLDRIGRKGGKLDPGTARRWIEERCGKIAPKPLTQTEVHKVIYAYWHDYHPAAAKLAQRVAETVRKEAIAQLE